MMEGTKTAQEGRYSIQNILRKDRDPDRFSVHSAQMPSTAILYTSDESSTLSRARADTPPTLGVNQTLASVTVNSRSNNYTPRGSGVRRQFEGEPAEGSSRPNCNAPPAHYREEKLRVSRTEEPYIPIWLLNSWASPSVASVCRQSTFGGSIAHGGVAPTLYQHANCDARYDSSRQFIELSETCHEKDAERSSCITKRSAGYGTAIEKDKEMTKSHRSSSFHESHKKQVSTEISPHPYIERKFEASQNDSLFYPEASSPSVETLYKNQYQNEALEHPKRPLFREQAINPSEILSNTKPLPKWVLFTPTTCQRSETGVHAFSHEMTSTRRLTSPQQKGRQSSKYEDRRSSSRPCMSVEPDKTQTLEACQQHAIDSGNIATSDRTTSPDRIVFNKSKFCDTVDSFLTSVGNLPGQPRNEPDIFGSPDREFVTEDPQDPSPLQYRVDESLISNVSQTQKGVTVTLLNSALWKAFSAVGTEMIINRSGRRMFPYLALSVSGLSPSAMYRLSLQILPASSRRFKYVTNRWLPVGIADTEALQDPYFHTDSLSSGDQLNKIKLIFSKVKLTNNKDSADCNIFLHSMHKYRIVTTFTEIAGGANLANQVAEHPGSSLSFHFPETDFIAVTAYQNEAVTQMKIHNNPFAKAFRDANFATFRRGVTSRRKRQALYTNTLKQTKRTRLSQHPTKRGISDIVPTHFTRDGCNLPRSSDQPEPSPSAKLILNFQATDTEQEAGSGNGDTDWAAAIDCDSNYISGSPSPSSCSPAPSPYFLPRHKLGLPTVYPWMGLYSDLVRSHLLQFQYLHVNAISAATPNSNPSTATTTTAANTETAPGGSGGIGAASWSHGGDSGRSSLQMVPIPLQTRLYPDLSESDGFCSVSTSRDNITQTNQSATEPRQLILSTSPRGPN